MQKVTSFAQENHILRIFADDPDKQIIERQIDFKSLKDSTDARLALSRMISDMQKEGYLLANIDKVSSDSVETAATIFLGSKYRWGELDLSGLPKNVRATLLKSRSHKAINDKADLAFKSLLRTSNNSGYPFASVRLEEVSIAESKVSGRVNLETGPYITFDSLIVGSNSPSRYRYLTNYLRIRFGEAYSEKKINQISQHFETLPYYQLTGPINLIFHNTNAEVQLDIEKINANRFDGIIGFLPNSDAEGKTVLTGELNLDLLNLFESGKELRFHWQRLRAETQLLDIMAKVPAVLKSPIDLIGTYSQLKEDTTFINRNARLSLATRVSPKSEFRFFADFKRAGLLSEEVEVVGDIPENADFDLNRYGIGYTYNSLGTVNLDKEGVRLNVEISTGTKKINTNSGIDQMILQGIDLNTNLLQIESAFAYQKFLIRNFSLYHSISTGHLVNENIFNNDMFRIGGINSLRGFNENFFFARNYVLSNLEARFFFDQRSYFFLFSDQSYLITESSGDVFSDAPLGFGMGLQIETSAGDLKLAYALGRSQDNPIQFNQSKIHFGLVSRF